MRSLAHPSHITKEIEFEEKQRKRDGEVESH